MEKFVLNITASSGEFFQGECESLTLPTADGQYGVQAGHSPVLVALEMGIMQFTVNGETVTSTADIEGFYGVEHMVTDESGVTYFAEQNGFAAPAFSLRIDGITELNTVY